MKARTLSLICFIVPLATYACSSDSGTTPQTEAGIDGSKPDGAAGAGGQDSSAPKPDGQTQDVVTQDTSTGDAADAADVAQPDEPAKLDEEGARLSLAETDMPSVNELLSIKGYINMFIDEGGSDPTLSPALTALQNLTRIHTRGNTFKSQCVGAENNLMSGATEYLAFSAPDCTLNDLHIQGNNQRVDVTKDSSGIKVKFTFNNLELNGSTLNGTATVTANGTGYPIVSDLSISSLSHMTFTGTGAISSGDASKLTSTMSGSGTAEALGADGGLDGSAAKKLTKEGWECVQNGPTAYKITDLARELGQCYANNGKLETTKVYDCEKKLTARTLKQSVTSTALVEWLPTTRDDRKVNVTLTNQIGDAGATPGTPVKVTMPWTCVVAPTPEQQPEPSPEAGSDAADDAADASADAATE